MEGSLFSDSVYMYVPPELKVDELRVVPPLERVTAPLGVPPAPVIAIDNCRLTDVVVVTGVIVRVVMVGVRFTVRVPAKLVLVA